MDINLELYKVFYYVATTLSFSEASRQLFLSQSAVSQSIKQLEHKLGHSLFVRSTKKVQLTPEGEILLQHVKPAIRMLSDGEDLLANSISPMEQIRIAASDTICRYFLIDYFKRFHKEHPEIRIKIINSTSIGCMELLDNGQADLAVCNAPNTRLRSYMRIKKILDFEDIFIASQDFFGEDPIPETLEELQKYPLLMLTSKSVTFDFLQQTFAAHGLKLLPEVELNSNDLLLDLAKIGLGIACVPDYMLRNQMQTSHSQAILSQHSPGTSDLIQIPLKTPLQKRQLVMVSHGGLPLSSSAIKFSQYF